jgi:hypothetical protein
MRECLPAGDLGGFASKVGFARALLNFLHLKQSILSSFLTFESKPT